MTSPRRADGQAAVELVALLPLAALLLAGAWQLVLAGHAAWAADAAARVAARAAAVGGDARAAATRSLPASLRRGVVVRDRGAGMSRSPSASRASSACRSSATPRVAPRSGRSDDAPPHRE